MVRSIKSFRNAFRLCPLETARISSSGCMAFEISTVVRIKASRHTCTKSIRCRRIAESVALINKTSYRTQLKLKKFQVNKTICRGALICAKRPNFLQWVLAASIAIWSAGAPLVCNLMLPSDLPTTSQSYPPIGMKSLPGLADSAGAAAGFATAGGGLTAGGLLVAAVAALGGDLDAALTLAAGAGLAAAPDAAVASGLAPPRAESATPCATRSMAPQPVKAKVVTANTPNRI